MNRKSPPYPSAQQDMDNTEFEERGRSFSPQDILKEIWGGRRYVYRFSAFFLVLGILYAWVTDPLYEASMTVTQKEDSASATSLASGLGATALSLLGGTNTLGQTLTEYTYTLHSTQLADVLLKKHPNIVKVLMPKWVNPTTQQFNGRPGIIAIFSRTFAFLGLIPKDTRLAPTAEDVENTLTNKIVVVQDEVTQYLTVSFDYKYPSVSYAALKTIITEADNIVRQQDMILSSHRVAYLNQILQTTTNPDYRNSFLSVLTGEQKKIMMAKSDPYYSFDVVDDEFVPALPVWPNIIILGVAAIALGLIMGISLTFMQLIFPGFRIPDVREWWKRGRGFVTGRLSKVEPH